MTKETTAPFAEYLFGAHNQEDSFTQPRLCCAVNDTVGWIDSIPEAHAQAYLDKLDSLIREITQTGSA